MTSSAEYRAPAWAILAALILITALAAEAGPVMVVTQPPSAGARIYEGSRLLATTAGDGSAVLTGLSPGEHQLRVVFPGGATSEQSCRVNSGSLASRLVIEAPTEVAPTVQLIVSGNVGNARVAVDGQDAGLTGSADGSKVLSLSPGRHLIRLFAEGYIAQEKTVELSPGPASRVVFELKQNRGGGTRQMAPTSSNLLTWVLIGLLAVAVGVVAVVAVHVVRQQAGGRVSTRRLDRYEMREIIGRGGMATIYKAIDTTDRNAPPVALKVLDEAHLADADLVHKFVREGEVLQRLNQTDPEAPLVRVHHFGRAGGTIGRPFIAMELLDGEDLLRHLKRRGQLPLKEAAHLCAGVARALKPAHAAGVYHRDLTPDNVILVSEPRGGYRLRLIDFGVARHEYTSHGTLDGSIAGKPPYMSPEQCQGMAVDGRSDIYALGIMLFSLITGKPPFTHTNPLEVMRMHKEEQVKMPEHFPQSVVLFLNRALAKEREARYQSVQEAFDDLQRLERMV